MALASAYGLQYELPGYGSQQAQGTTRGAAVPPQASGFGDDNLLSQELYVKEGMTDEYYKKVSALKSYANEISSRYGFDVTRPDYRNPDSIRFHRSYLEALADLQATQNGLRRLASQENIALQNPNIRQRTDAQGQDYFANIGENSVVASMKNAANNIKSREGLQGFQVAKEDLIEQLSEELATAQTPRERDQITASIRQLESIRPDVGISDVDQARIDQGERQLEQTKQYQDASLGLRGRELDIAETNASQTNSWGDLTKTQVVNGLGRFDTIQNLSNPTTLKNLGLDRVDRSSGTYLEGMVNGRKESVKIDPKDPQGTLFQVNELINKLGEGAAVPYDLLTRFPNMDLDGIAQEVIASLNPSDDKFSGFIQQFPEVAKQAASTPIKGEALATSLTSKDVKIPSSISSTFTNGVASDMDVQKAEYTSGLFGGSPGIKITLQKKNQSDKMSTRTLYFGKDEDVKLMQEIFEYNSRNVNLPPAITGEQGTVVAPTSGRGTDINLDKM